MLLHGRPPSALGYPSWRTRVAYVPQSRPSTLSGTPAELYALAQQLGAQRQRPRGDLPSLVHEMGLEQRVLHQQWGELSVRGLCFAPSPVVQLQWTSMDCQCTASCMCKSAPSSS